MQNLAATFQCRVFKQPKRRGLYLFYGNPRRVIWIAEKRTVGFESLCNGSFNS
jgi:hypothetical protein